MATVKTKSLTFTLDPSFKGPCSLTLGFVPDAPETFESMHPVAWKVFEIKGNNSQTVVWNDNLAGCRATVDKSYVVTAHEYISIPPGHFSNLSLDKSTPTEPLYTFSPPEPFGGDRNTQVRVGSVTKTTTEEFGTGFVITDDDNKETMEPVLTTDALQHGETVYINYIPQLKVWVDLNYKQAEILDKSVKKKQVVWEADLSKLKDSRVQIWIKRDPSGDIKGTTDSLITLQHQTVTPQGLNCPCIQAIYTANLTFVLPGLVGDGLRAIIDNLSNMAYTATKTVYKGYDTEATLTLSLPPSKNCNQAEQDMIRAIGNACVYGQAFIKAHSGAICLTINNGRETWMEINPASPQWFDTVSYYSSDLKTLAFDGVADAEAFAVQVDVAQTSGGRRGGRRGANDVA
ncbi:hypothetical protein TRAPUB_11768 [Trametes pubescens]|uniref:Uncharacterized protein n=1 Tax=Trametes pubescens TaxID=154538 RepID=A0A1M2VW06_TRAPU|nr:hypothetical protein TRAPUB_11768 [Trametes pubescens]